MNVIQKAISLCFETNHSEVVKAVMSMCNGNLLAISRQRHNNMIKHNDPDYVPTIDAQTPAADAIQRAGGSPAEQDVASDEHTAADHTKEIGYEPGLTLVQRADIFASIAKFCVEMAEEKGWTKEFEMPRTFEQFYDSQIKRLREDDAAIENFVHIRGVPLAQLRVMALEANREEALKLESMKADLMAMQSEYDDTIDIDEALDTLGKVGQHRVLVKVASTLMYIADRKLKTIMQFKRGPLVDNLIGERELILGDVDKLEKAIVDFETFNKAAIGKELNGTNRALTTMIKSHTVALELFRRQRKEEAEAMAMAKLKMQAAA